MGHDLKLTTTQASKLYALTGQVAYSDPDMRDVRNQLSNSLGEAGEFEQFGVDFHTVRLSFTEE